MSLRLRCKIMGCAAHRQYPACEYCGADLYEDFIQIGWIDPLYRLRDWLYLHLPHSVKCSHCGKRLRLTCLPQPEIDFCSEKCSEDWMPF